MELGFIGNLFFVLAAALIGGLGAKLLRLRPIIGYIIAGIIFGSILPLEVVGVEKLAEVGIILLLFSIGL
ncbi:portal protein, partial [Candidatus Woesebacteria bacterium]|nr:portal protein [Candidatus Woesebacteria bacterium]